MQLLDPVTGAPNPATGINGRLTTKAANAIAVTKSDATIYDPPLEVYVGGTGNIAVVPYGRKGDASVTFTAVPAGTFLPILCKQVLSTGTTATAIVGSF